MIKGQLEGRKKRLNQAYERLAKLDTFINKLSDETYTGLLDKTLIFGEEVNKIQEQIKEIKKNKELKKREQEYENEGSNKSNTSQTNKRVKVTDFKVEYTDSELEQGVLGVLVERLEDIHEAIAIYNDTNDYPEKKLRYMLTKTEYNQHLENLGYFDDMVDYVQEKIDGLLEKRVINYFKVTVRGSQFIGRKIRVDVQLDTSRIPDINMYTTINLTDKEGTYPTYLGFSSEYSSYYTSQAKLMTKIQDMEDKLDEFEKEYTHIGSKIESIQGDSVKMLLLNKKLKQLYEDKGNVLHSIYGVAYSQTHLKEDIKEHIKIIDTLEEHLPRIEEEQHGIMQDIGELLGVTMTYNNKGFSN